MNVRRGVAVVVLLVIGITLGRTTGQAQSEQDAKKQADGFAMQAAKLNLQLAEMNLERMNRQNRRVPGTVIQGLIDMFAQEVELARAELSIFEKNAGGSPYLAMVERMRLAVRFSKARADRALAMFEKAPEIMSRTDVERMRNMARIADLQLQRGLALEKASAGDQLQWQLEVYGDELDRVRIYTWLLGQNRFGEFSPGL
jgi:hypothetical protein